MLTNTPRESIAVAEAPDAAEFTWANRRPGTRGFARWTATLDRRIDERGLDACTRDICKLAAVAIRSAISSDAVQALIDVTQPDAVRRRAFARVISELSAIPHAKTGRQR
jgi:hypothetical protein